MRVAAAIQEEEIRFKLKRGCPCVGSQLGQGLLRNTYLSAINAGPQARSCVYLHALSLQVNVW